MTSDLWSIFVVNVAVNSFLSFFTLSLLIFFSLKILRIKSTRVQAFCFMIPFMKIIADLACYQFSHWALAQQLNPLTSPVGTRILSAYFWFMPFRYPLCSVDFHLIDGQTFTLADLFCLKIGSEWTAGCALVLIAGTLGFLWRAIQQYRLSNQRLNEIRSTSILYEGPLQDLHLASKFQRKKVSIYLTSLPHSPFITGLRHPAIFIPQPLFDELTTQEFEAIIAHEMSHFHYGDLFVNASLFWICHFFWWIPTRYFKGKLELAQEYACDCLHGTNIDRLHLAQALYKSAHWLKAIAPLPIMAQLFVSPHHAVKRLQALLASPKNELFILKWVKIFALACWIFVLFLGKFWTF